MIAPTGAEIIAAFDFSPLASVFTFTDCNVTLTNISMALSPSSYRLPKASRGGALFVSRGSVELTRCSFESFGASEAGAVWIDSANTKIVETTFTRNQAASMAGALYIGSSNVVSLAGCSFIESGRDVLFDC